MGARSYQEEDLELVAKLYKSYFQTHTLFEQSLEKIILYLQEQVKKHPLLVFEEEGINVQEILKIAELILILIIIFAVGIIFEIVLAVKDSNTDFVKEINITNIDCNNLSEKIIELDYICGKYFTVNRQTYCKRNITNYYLDTCSLTTELKNVQNT